MKTLSILVLCLAALPAAGEVQPREQRKPAPSFSLRDAKGKEVRLAQYRGKVLLLNFWATWCGGCKQEMPHFDEVQRTLGKRKFAALGVSVDEKGWAVVNPFLRSTKVKYRMALATAEATSQFDVKSLPATFVIDKDGNVAATYMGLVKRKELEADLRALLAAE